MNKADPTITRKTKEEFVSHLMRNYPSGAIIKVFQKRDYLLDLAKGVFCIGTTEYYRREDEKDGRGDTSESVLKKVVANGEKFHASTMNITVKIDNYDGEIECKLPTDAMVFSMMQFKCTDVSNEHIRKQIDKDALGVYVAVFQDKAVLEKCFENLSFLRAIDGSNLDIDCLKQKNGNVEYVDLPDDSCFQKKDVFPYNEQDEFRFVFGIKGSHPHGVVSLCLYLSDNWPQCELFEIVD